MHRLDVLALIDHFVLGGAETLLARFATVADQAGIDLRIACLQELDGNPAAKPLVELGMPPVDLDLRGRPGLHALRTVRRHIAERCPDLLHTHLGTADLLGGVAARSLGVPVVSTVHAMHWGRGEWLHRQVVRHCAQRVIAVSEGARREYLRQGWAREGQIVTVHNGLDLSPCPGEGRAVRRELGLEPEDLVVAMVSALRPEKGHDVAVEAVRALRSRFPRLRLLIVGQGDLRAELDRAAEQAGGAIVMTGLRHDVMRVLDAADLCLQPSRADAFPTTLIEAMAASVPILASAVGGIPEIVADGVSGVLVPAPPSPEELARALAALLEDPARRRTLADTARRTYEERFTAAPWVHGTRAVYDAVLAERERAPGLRRAAVAEGPS